MPPPCLSLSSGVTVYLAIAISRFPMSEHNQVSKMHRTSGCSESQSNLSSSILGSRLLQLKYKTLRLGQIKKMMIVYFCTLIYVDTRVSCSKKGYYSVPAQNHCWCSHQVPLIVSGFGTNSLLTNSMKLVFIRHQLR